MKQTFDYDNSVGTFLAGAVMSWLSVAFFALAYAGNWGAPLLVFSIPREAFLLLAVCCCIPGVYFPLLQKRRKTHPHRIAIDESSIEVPTSRFSNEHTKIPFDRIESIVLSELGAGYQNLAIFFQSKEFTVSENIFAKRSDFKRVVEAVLGKPSNSQ